MKNNEPECTFAKKAMNQSFLFIKDAWDATKRESQETKDAAKILFNILSGKKTSQTDRKFLIYQTTDIAKLIPLLVVKGIPVPVPITPLLVFVCKKAGFDILPNSHKKIKKDGNSYI